jgi:hypothetical protein
MRVSIPTVVLSRRTMVSKATSCVGS